MTLKDIAQKAGVSMMTVSNVVNGRTERVSSQTIERVNKIIEECGYVPNMTARSMATNSSHIIGIIIFMSESDTKENYLGNPYISAMLSTLEYHLKEGGYFIMLRTVSNRSEILTLLKSWNVDGFVFLFPFEESEEVLKSIRQPAVIFDSYASLPDIITVSSDDVKGCYLSAKYMISHGHKDIAFVADYKNNALLTARFHGYQKALEEAGIPFRPEYVYHFSPTYEGGIMAGKRIASDPHPITGAVTTADICATGIIEGARLGGLRVPADLSVIGYDDAGLCSYTTPKLTSVAQHVTEKAEMAAEKLLEWLKTGKRPEPLIVMDVEITERQSVVSWI